MHKTVKRLLSFILIFGIINIIQYRIIILKIITNN